MSTTVVPPGFSPALHPITAQDHGGYATIASGCGLVIVMTFTAARLLNRSRVDLQLSDHTLFTAAALTLVQSILVFLLVDEGFGSFTGSLSSSSIETISRMVYTSSLLYILALFLSKISLLCLIWRLSIERTHSILAQASVAVTSIVMVASFLMVALGCNITTPWEQATSLCDNLFKRWVAIEVLGILVELAVLTLIVRIYYGLQRTWKWKVRGAGVFGLRVGVIPFAVLRLVALRDTKASENPLFDRVPVVTWTQTALAYSMATATVPCLLAFIINLNTGFGTFNAATVMEQTQQDSKNFSAGHYELQSMNKSVNKNQSRNIAEGHSDGANYKWAINSRRAEERSIASDDSQNMIIRKTVEFGASSEGL